MLDWASAMYHAIAIANGGSYILQYERDRLAAEAEAALRRRPPPPPPGHGAPTNSGARAALEALERAMATARYSDTSGLESAMRMARKKGLDTAAAEALLHALQVSRRHCTKTRK